MKRLSLCFFTCILIFAQALWGQLWSPPGAVWTSNLQGLAVEGCEHAAYVGDTLYEGRTAQHIAVEDIVMDHIVNVLDTNAWDLYTNEVDSIVYAWTDNEGWDTLYWFSAVPGDRWYPAGLQPNGTDYCGMMEVLDTMHVEVNGSSIRQVTCAFLDGSGATTVDAFTMTELFGTGSMHFLDGGCFVVEAGWSLHTYSDGTFPLYDSGAGSNCDNFLGIAVNERSLEVSVSPNPGTDLLHVETGMNSKVNVSVRDAMGRTVLAASGTGGPIEMNSAGISPGVYVVEVSNAQGRRTVKWMKE